MYIYIYIKQHATENKRDRSFQGHIQNKYLSSNILTKWKGNTHPAGLALKNQLA